MALRGDDRAVSELIGVVLLFGFLVVSLSAYQVTVVPNDNRNAEFDHNERVQSQLQDVRDAVVAAGATDTDRSVSVDLGTRYRNRVLFVNPPTPGGTLRTEVPEPGTVSIRGADAAAAGAPEAGDFWTGAEREVPAAHLEYDPDYNEYRTAPVTVHEYGVLYNRFGSGPDNRTLPYTGQPIVDGRQIDLVVLNGSLRESGSGTASLDVRPTSASTTEVPVRNASDPVSITLPTRLSEAQWRELLDEELVANGGHVQNVAYAHNGPYATVTIELEPGVTYDLHMAKVGVGSGVEPEGPAYLVPVSGDNETVAAGGTQRLVVEVRDRFNNPVGNVTVDATVTSGSGSLGRTTATTGSDGRAAFVYEAPDGSGEATVEASFDGGTGARERTAFDLSVLAGSGGGTTYQSIDGGHESGVVLDDVRLDGSGGIDVTFENTGSTDREAFEARLVAYFNPGSNPSNGKPIGEADYAGTTLQLWSDYTALNANYTVESGTTETVKLGNLEDTDGNAVDADRSDFFIVSVRYESPDGERTTATYYAQPRD